MLDLQIIKLNYMYQEVHQTLVPGKQGGTHGHRTKPPDSICLGSAHACVFISTPKQPAAPGKSKPFTRAHAHFAHLIVYSSCLFLHPTDPVDTRMGTAHQPLGLCVCSLTETTRNVCLLHILVQPRARSQIGDRRVASRQRVQRTGSQH